MFGRGWSRYYKKEISNILFLFNSWLSNLFILKKWDGKNNFCHETLIIRRNILSCSEYLLTWFLWIKQIVNCSFWSFDKFSYPNEKETHPLQLMQCKRKLMQLMTSRHFKPFITLTLVLPFSCWHNRTGLIVV